MIDHDKPIERPDQDLFKRSDFALTLARTIADLPVASDGFVFAITGSWGSGKSSVLKLIERYLYHLEMALISEQPLPWQITPRGLSVDELEQMAIYYERVSPRIADLEAGNKYLANASLDYQRKLCRDCLDSDEKAEQALSYWHLRNRVLPRVIVVTFSPWLIAGRAELASALLSELARSLSKFLGTTFQKPFADLLRRLSEFAPVVGAGLDLSGSGLGALVSATGLVTRRIAQRMTKGPTLDSLHAELRAALRSLDGQRILVIVDDLDRLTPSEAAEMAAIVKSLGDLPNVIYLLSYDRHTVAKLIRTALRVDGEKYLEKIVQQNVELPPVHEDDLGGAVNSSVKEVFVNTIINQGRFSALWLDVLRHYIRNPRDVRRYFNSLAFSQSGLGSYTDPIDLMTLQALQVFEPNVYRHVLENLDEMVS